MAKKRRKPRVYLDTSCIGRILDGSGDARDALLALLASIQYKQLVFVSSAWLLRELSDTEPVSDRIQLTAAVPKGEWVQWDRTLARHAQRLVIPLQLDDDPSGVADCRHVASAPKGQAEYLITHDSRFFEAMRQSGKLIAPLRPARLVQWQEDVYGS